MSERKSWMGKHIKGPVCEDYHPLMVRKHIATLMSHLVSHLSDTGCDVTTTLLLLLSAENSAASSAVDLVVFIHTLTINMRTSGVTFPSDANVSL